MTEKITKLALATRVIVLVLQLLANVALPDHQPDVFRGVMPIAEIHNNISESSSTASPSWLDKSVYFCLRGLRHWDGEYYLHIAEHTYSYENTLAFYPLYPLLVRTGAQLVHYVSFDLLTLHTCHLLVAVLLNLLFFCKAANTLYALTQRIFNDPHKSWNAALLFCFNPASIFFTAAYSEALFCLLSLQLMLECVVELRFVRTTVALALSIVSRSNGLVNAGFAVYFMLRKFILKPMRWFLIVKILLCLGLALMPLTFYCFYAFQQFCQPTNVVSHTEAVRQYANAHNYVLAGERQAQNSPWCDETFPFPYSYIQSHYWNVGFLRYYELKQWPNFLLAFPVLAFLCHHCLKYLRHFMGAMLPKYGLLPLLKEYKSLPFVLHAIFLTAFCTFFVHIQVSTRLLCSATPCLYWFAADHLPKTFDQIKLRSKAGAIVAWFGCYYLAGTVLFSNNLPWT